MVGDSRQVGGRQRARPGSASALLLLCGLVAVSAVLAGAEPMVSAAQAVAAVSAPASSPRATMWGGAQVVTAVPSRASLTRTSAGAPAPAPMARATLHDAMRKLWEDHVAWTRLYIVSAAGNLPDKSATADRLLRNQADIGNAVAELYGRPAGDALTALLRSHILVAAELVDDAKAGDQAKVADASRRWYANADSIAHFLNAANPRHWPLATLQASMKTHLDQTLAEATDQLHGNYAASVTDYDHVVAHILELADVLSGGIEAQFPARFTGAPVATR